MQKKSVFLKLFLSLMIFHIIYSVVFAAYFVLKDFPQRLEKYQNQAQLTLIAFDFIYPIDHESAIAILDFAFDNVSITSYEIFENRKLVLHKGEVFLQELTKLNIETEQMPYYTFITHNNSNFSVRVSFVNDWKIYLVNSLFNNSNEYIFDILYICSLLVFLSLYFFRDILKILSLLSQRGIKRSDLSIAQSTEAQTLVRGLLGYEEVISGLERESSLLKNQVLSALKNELWSGKKPPYDFMCTLVRTDINDFTPTFNDPTKREDFLALINEFFVGVTTIASRYDGSIYQFVGDEVIYYFKDEPNMNSSSIAISALRDVDQLAEKIHQKALMQYGFGFKIKSSLSHGELRFGSQVNAYSFSGVPLIESGRLLNHLPEKGANPKVYTDAIDSQIKHFCESESIGSAQLKGLGERKLYLYKAHTPIELFLQKNDLASLKYLEFYRSDQDIYSSLNWVQQKLLILDVQNEFQLKYILEIIKYLRAYKAFCKDFEVRNLYIQILNKLGEQCMQSGVASELEAREKIMASLVILAPLLFDKSLFEGPLKDALLAVLNLQNERVLANLIDVLGEFDPSLINVVFTKITENPHNRIAANLIIMESKQQWNKSLAKKIKSLIKNSSPFYCASGLYALGEVSKHMRESDAVAFHTNKALQDLLKLLPEYSLKANPMIERQAKIAIEKSQHLKTDEIKKLAS